MADLLPYLIIQAPNDSQRRVSLTKTRYTIGRLPENDIALLDDRTIITRIEHCVLERTGRDWWLTDKSTNGTILQREEQQVEVQSYPNAKIQIGSGDRICIHDWELTFYDLNQTSPLRGLSLARSTKSTCPLVYKLRQATLYRVIGGDRQEIALRPQLRKMLGYMAQKNLANDNEPTLCHYQELIIHIWGTDAFDYDRRNQDINGLAKDFRKLVSVQLSSEWTPEALLKTVKGEGYILCITCEP